MSNYCIETLRKCAKAMVKKETRVGNTLGIRSFSRNKIIISYDFMEGIMVNEKTVEEFLKLYEATLLIMIECLGSNYLIIEFKRSNLDDIYNGTISKFLFFDNLIKLGIRVLDLTPACISNTYERCWFPDIFSIGKKWDNGRNEIEFPEEKEIFDNYFAAKFNLKVIKTKYSSWFYRSPDYPLTMTELQDEIEKDPKVSYVEPNEVEFDLFN